MRKCYSIPQDIWKLQTELLLDPNKQSPILYIFFQKTSNFPIFIKFILPLFFYFFNFLVFSEENNIFVTWFKTLKLFVKCKQCFSFGIYVIIHSNIYFYILNTKKYNCFSTFFILHKLQITKTNFNTFTYLGSKETRKLLTPLFFNNHPTYCIYLIIPTPLFSRFIKTLCLFGT